MTKYIEEKFLRFPAIYFGNKSRVGKAVWKRFGNVDRYIEPFCGSCGVFWKRPLSHFSDGRSRSEILNDRDSYLTNFLRSVLLEPQKTAFHSVNPVTELDLIARYRYLAFGPEKKGLKMKMKTDPDYCNPKLAGWWAWGMSCWIGGDRFFSMVGDNWTKIPELQTEKGCTKPAKVKVTREGLKTIAYQADQITRWYNTLSNRMFHARITCGDWSRVVSSPSLLRGAGAGKVGVFLDPPYPTVYEDGKKSTIQTYDTRDNKEGKLIRLQKDVFQWCQDNGDLRVAVCGYAGDGYEKLVKDFGWTELKWKASGGFSNLGKTDSIAKKNSVRERIWFSPSCLKTSSLF